jgi:micrococcal nuclease
MQIIRTLVLFVVAVVQTSGSHDPVLVTNVVSGNAIQVASIGSVRLSGIDAPHLVRGVLDQDPIGRAAVERLVGLVAHRWVRLEFEGRGRGSAYVLLEDGTFVNAVLVREGLARATKRGSSARERQLLDAEAEARSSRRGLWARPATGGGSAARAPSSATSSRPSPATARV